MSAQDFNWVLQSVAQLQRIPFDAGLLAQQFPLPYTRSKLMSTLHAMRFRTGEGRVADLGGDNISFPCLAFRLDRTRDSAEQLVPAIVVGYSVDKVLYFESSNNEAKTSSLEDFVAASIAEANTLHFGPDISTATLSVAQSQDNLILTIGDPAFGDSVTIVGGASRDVIARVEFNDGMVWDATMLRSVAVLIPDLVPTFESFPPAADSGSADPIIGAGGGGEPEASTPSTDAGERIAGGDQAPGSDFPIPLPSVFVPTESNDALAGASVEFGGAGLAQFSAAEISGPFSSNSLAPLTLSLPQPALAFGPSVPNSSRGSAGAVGASVSAMPDGNGPSVGRARDAMSSFVSSGSVSADDATGSQDGSAFESRTVQRETEPGGLTWLAQQNDAPREATPALTPWAIANALLQFRLSSTDESTTANSSAGFINSPIAGLPGLSELAPLGMGASGLGGEGARLQSFSGLREGLVALAA